MALGKKTGGRIAVKNCTTCGKDLDLDPSYNGYRRRAKCKTCVNEFYRGRHTEYQNEYKHRPEVQARKRELALVRQYGMTKEEYNEMFKVQGGVCAICHQSCPTGRDLQVDHNHTTNEIRGLLCIKCNVAIGSLNEDPDLIMALYEYLTRTTWNIGFKNNAS